MKSLRVKVLSIFLLFFAFHIPHTLAAGDPVVELQLAEVIEQGTGALAQMGIQGTPEEVAGAVQGLAASVIGYLNRGDKLTLDWVKAQVSTAFGRFFPGATRDQQVDDAANVLYNGLKWKSPYSAIAADTAVFGGGFLGILSYTFMIKKMVNLQGFAKTVLVNAPLITGALPRFPLGWYANRADGGVHSLRIATLLTAVGLASIAVLSHFTELESIESAEDPSYWAWLGAGLFVGAGISTYAPGVINTKNWAVAKQAGLVQGIFGGLGNLTPAILAATLAHIIGGIGETWTYSIWTGVIGLVALGTFPFLATPPAQVAAKAATAAGLRMPSANFWTAAGKALISPENWIYSYIYLASFGAFVAMPNILGFYNSDPHYLANPYGLEPSHLGYIIAGYIATSSLTRTFSGFPVDKFGGPVVAISGLLLGTLGTLPMALYASPLDGSNVAGSVAWWSGLTAMGLGWGATMAATFGWIAQNTPPAGFGIKAGMVGAIGACGFINAWLAYYMGGWASTSLSGSALLAASGLFAYQKLYLPRVTAAAAAARGVGAP